MVRVKPDLLQIVYAHLARLYLPESILLSNEKNNLILDAKFLTQAYHSMRLISVSVWQGMVAAGFETGIAGWPCIHSVQ